MDWTDQPSRPRHTTRTSSEIEDAVLRVRKDLRESSVLGEYSARAIEVELKRQGFEAVPSVRTIGRIFKRRGALDRGRRIRRKPPPKGWYLPPVARREVELDSFDVVEGLIIQGGIDVQVLNGISLHGRLVVSWPMSSITAKVTVEKLALHWQESGLPGYVQFDNDTRFQGAHQHRDSFSRVMRLCMSLGVIPVFAPVREYGFQAAVESYNGLWQTKVWSRFHHDDLAHLQDRSDRYVRAHRAKTSDNRRGEPVRAAFPNSWKLDLQAPLRGKVVYLRRTNGAGRVFLLGRQFVVSDLWLYRLVRCDVDLDERQIDFFTLRRAHPESHELINTVQYIPPSRPFHG
ncbi:MAG: hypothetical protein GY906_35405 [bacterium]|nr:hypothetical protein [bacterium]